MGRGLALLVAALLPAVARAAAWVPPPGGHYAKLDVAFFEGRAAPGLTGAVAGARYRARRVSLYGEVGLVPHVGLVLAVPYADATVRYPAAAEERSRSGLADLDALLKVGTVRGLVAVAARAGVRVPAYDLVPVISCEDALAPRAPDLGSGRAEVAAAIAVGRSLWPRPGYVVAEVGPRLRVADDAGAIQLAGEAGYALGRVGLGARAEAQLGYGAPHPQCRVPGQGRDLKLTGKAALRLVSGLSLELAAGWVLPGVSTGPGWDVSAGVSWKGGY